MQHIGVICPAYTGHLNPMSTLSREMQRRGYRITMIVIRDGEAKIHRSGLEYCAIGEKEFPLGAVAQFTEEQGQLKGLRALQFICDHIRRMEETYLRELPDVVNALGIDAMMVDQVTPGAASVAEKAALPFATICNAMAIHSEPDIPPFMMPWQYRPDPLGRLRNRLGYRIADHLVRPVLDSMNRTRAEWGLSKIVSLNLGSPLAQITQQPAFFDFPRHQLPDHFHYTGPFHDERSGEPIAFPWERLDGRPLIYASMGTLQNRLTHVFRTIAEACQGLDAQLVLTFGSKEQEVPTDFPGNPIVVNYAPQLELLHKASLVITHAGQNTVLEALAQGVPMVAIPVANDQPGVASRLTYIGAGKMIPLASLTTSRLRTAVQTVLSQSSFREKARQYQQEITRLDGVHLAADIVEKAIATRKPVLREMLKTQ